MAQTVEAIYENGILRPLKPLEGIAEHRRVKVTGHGRSGTWHRAYSNLGCCNSNR